MPYCPFCQAGPLPPGRQTCGNSYCQEADYYQNKAQLTRGKKRAAAQALAAEKSRIADEAGRQRCRDS